MTKLSLFVTRLFNLREFFPLGSLLYDKPDHLNLSLCYTTTDVAFFHRSPLLAFLLHFSSSEFPDLSSDNPPMLAVVCNIRFIIVRSAAVQVHRATERHDRCHWRHGLALMQGEQDGRQDHMVQGRQAVGTVQGCRHHQRRTRPDLTSPQCQ